ncbi:MAG: cation:proton antiporter [Bryobacteraceae bacterium]
MTDSPFVWMNFLLAGGAEAAKLPLEMVLVFGAAKLFDELFERLHQPGIVGQIVAGILIGPSVLGWIRPSEFLTALSELGVMFLLFRVGLEVKASELVRVGLTATTVAVLGVVAPFLLGWGILRLWGEPHIEAIFVGAAMVATSVGITAQVLAAKGLLQERASKIILAAAVIDDILGLLILALVSSLAKGSVNLLELVLTSLMAVGFTAIVVTLGTRTMERVVPRLDQSMRGSESQFAVAMILMFGLSLLAVYAGVAAIIGAFLAGMALAESVHHRVHDLTQGVTELLVPFFLAGIGLHFNLAVFSQPSTLVLAMIILLAAVVSKFLGCGLGAWGLGRADALRVGVGMIPRGEVGMLVAQLGLSMGVIGPNIYAVTVFMALATTLVAPPLIRMAYRSLIRPEASAVDHYRLG